MEELGKEIKTEEKKLEKVFTKPGIWMIASAVLLVALVAVLIFGRGSSGATIGENEAGDKLISFINGNLVQDGSAELKNVTDKGSLYEAVVLYQGQEIPVYITKDGKYFVQAASEISEVEKLKASADSETPAPAADVPKTDNPKVEAFVFTYCPYGLQFEKALSPVYNLLKNKADINLVQIGAMHGEYEKVEAYRQLCIEEKYDKATLWKYLDIFMGNTAIGACAGDATCLKPLLSDIMANLSIDEDKIETCMEKDAEALYTADGARASSLGISGSPTFVINGVELQVGRTPDAIKTAICNAFTTAPSECSQNLSTGSMTPGFGYSAGASTGASCG